MTACLQLPLGAGRRIQPLRDFLRIAALPAVSPPACPRSAGDGDKCDLHGNVGATGTYLMNGQTLDALAFPRGAPPPPVRQRASVHAAARQACMDGETLCSGRASLTWLLPARCQGSLSARQLAVPTAPRAYFPAGTDWAQCRCCELVSRAGELKPQARAEDAPLMLESAARCPVNAPLRLTVRPSAPGARCPRDAVTEAAPWRGRTWWGGAPESCCRAASSPPPPWHPWRATSPPPS